MKPIKLLFIAIALIGAIYGIMSIIPDSVEDEGTPELVSEQANMWKQKIVDLCKDEAWTTASYEKIEKGIHSDRVVSNGETVTIDEENALQKYLFASSCRWLYEVSDSFFKQESYEENKYKLYDSAMSFLMDKKEKFSDNSNYEKANKLFASYHQLLSLLSFGRVAAYSHPLKAYDGGSADGRKQKIERLSHYQSHFVNNSSIKSRVATLESDMAKAEQDYYRQLEKCIESNYSRTNDFELLLQDQVDFKRISTDEVATKRLSDFVNNPK